MGFKVAEHLILCLRNQLRLDLLYSLLVNYHRAMSLDIHCSVFRPDEMISC